MLAHEKAPILIGMFKRTASLTDEQAKQCSILHAKEMIITVKNTIGSFDSKAAGGHWRLKFWENVLHHLEK